MRLIVRRVSRRPVPSSPSSPDTAITPSSPTAMGRRWNWRPIIAATPRSRRHTRPQVRRSEPHAVGALRRQGAWLAVQVMAHNLARWTARIGLGQQIVTTKFLRRRVFVELVGRISLRPWETQFSPWPGCTMARPSTPQSRATPVESPLSRRLPHLGETLRGPSPLAPSPTPFR